MPYPFMFYFSKAVAMLSLFKRMILSWSTLKSRFLAFWYLVFEKRLPGTLENFRRKFIEASYTFTNIGWR